MDQNQAPNQPAQLADPKPVDNARDPNMICGEICFIPKKSSNDSNSLDAEASEALKASMIKFFSNNDAFKDLVNSNMNIQPGK